MIITKIQGGLGNQMFQYAISRHLAEINNMELKFDISYYKIIKKNNSPRKYLLDQFNIKENFINDNDIKKIKINNIENRFFLSRAKMRLLKYIEEITPIHKRSYIKEPYFNFCANILNAKNKNIYLCGHWQSEKYFKNIKNIIRKEFTLRNKMSNNGQKITNIIKNTQSISIHIRRGDYAENKETNQYHGLCSLKYYYDSIEKITKHIKNPYFFIFSDDIKWAKNNLKIKFPVLFVSGNFIKDCEELILMSKCKHNIIANSSFSWWGAWLNNNQKKIVIVPKKWFNNSPNNTKDLCPEFWLKI